MTKPSLEKFTILVVDDNPRNLAVVVDALETKYESVLVAQDGESAIRRAKYTKPHLILLDVLMPGIDGFETCDRLKKDSITQDIPIVFMTALANTEDKVKGFQLGAIDYITKPIQQDELFARIKVHLKIQDLTSTLAQKNKLLTQYTEALESKVEERTAELSTALKQLQLSQVQLIQQEKMSSLGQLVTGLTHEINNPVNFIHGNVEHMRNHLEDLLSLIELYKESYPEVPVRIKEREKKIDLSFVQEDLPNIMESIRTGTERIREIIVSSRRFSRADSSNLRKFDIHQGIDSTLLLLKHRLKANEIRPEIQLVKSYEDLPLTACYSGSLNQVFMNLLSNSIDALEDNNQSKSYKEIQAEPNQIKITTQIIDYQWVKVAIADNAGGIPEAIQNQIFEPFFTTKPIGEGTGIGLSISHQIITEKHQGKLEYSSQEGQGTEFRIYIPIVPIQN
ncbi:MAG: response regulator [Limnothrix sp.]